jgi:hypothetical protein
MREAIARLFGAELGTDRITSAQVTFEYLLVGSYLNGPKGTGLHTGKALDTVIIVYDYRPRVFIHVHGIGNRASILTGRVLAVFTDYGKREWIFFRITYTYPRQRRLNHTRMFQRAHYLTSMTPCAKLLNRFKNLFWLHHLPSLLAVLN